MFSAVEIAITAFAVSNSVRVLAYVPQILRVARDRDGAAAVSCLTWLMFALSHLSTVAYALIVIEDWRMAAIFGVNLLCCLAIIGITCHKRALGRSQPHSAGRGFGARLRARLAPHARAASARYSSEPSRR